MHMQYASHYQAIIFFQRAIQLYFHLFDTLPLLIGDHNHVERVILFIIGLENVFIRCMPTMFFLLLREKYVHGREYKNKFWDQFIFVLLLYFISGYSIRK